MVNCTDQSQTQTIQLNGARSIAAAKSIRFVDGQLSEEKGPAFDGHAVVVTLPPFSTQTIPFSVKQSEQDADHEIDNIDGRDCSLSDGPLYAAESIDLSKDRKGVEVFKDYAGTPDQQGVINLWIFGLIFWLGYIGTGTQLRYLLLNES